MRLYKHIFNYRIFYIIQAILKYLPFKTISKIRPLIYKPFFKGIGKGTIIHDDVLFKFPEDILLGEHVQIAQQCILVGGSGLKIGDNVMIGAGTKIITSSHNYHSVDIPMIDQGLSFKSIEIKNDVWFGFNCIVLGGAIIGKGCIVAANAVVKEGKYDEYSIIGGVPAKIIKKRK